MMNLAAMLIYMVDDDTIYNYHRWLKSVFTINECYAYKILNFNMCGECKNNIYK